MIDVLEMNKIQLKLPLKLIVPVKTHVNDKIEKCLKDMRAKSASIAIAVDDRGHFQGLFTERDYFKKGHLIERLMTKGTELRVSVCMDKTIVPIAAQDVHLAHSYMLRTGRRYIPIAVSREDLHSIVGVLSLDELLRFYLSNPISGKPQSTFSGRKQISLGIVSRDNALLHNFESVIGKRDEVPRLHIGHINMGHIVTSAQIQMIGESYDGIFIDARTLQTKKWVKLAYNWFKNSNPKRVAILSRPERLAGQVSQSLLHLLEEHPIFHFFSRPKSSLEAAKTTLDFLRVF